MREGIRLPSGRATLAEARQRAKMEIGRLPVRLRSILPADAPYPVQISKTLDERRLTASGCREN
jgi:hypothetical protein